MMKLGKLVATIGVMNEIENNKNFEVFVNQSLSRYIQEDWGEMCNSDKKLNDLALKSGEDRIFAAYEKDNYKIWIITEWDRSATTILFPHEY